MQVYTIAKEGRTMEDTLYRENPLNNTELRKKYMSFANYIIKRKY